MVANERPPTPDGLRQILAYGDPCSKTMCSLLAFAGLRNGVMGNSIGKDALRIKDLPEIECDNESNTVNFTKIHTMVIVRSKLSKAKHTYFTFLGGEGCKIMSNTILRSECQQERNSMQIAG
jgi:hypothetical protein